MLLTKTFAQSPTKQIDSQKWMFQYKNNRWSQTQKSWLLLVFHQDYHNHLRQILLLQCTYLHEEKVYVCAMEWVSEHEQKNEFAIVFNNPFI